MPEMCFASVYFNGDSYYVARNKDHAYALYVEEQIACGAKTLYECAISTFEPFIEIFSFSCVVIDDVSKQAWEWSTREPYGFLGIVRKG